MQDETGLKRVLSASGAYEAFQAAIGARYARRWIAEHLWCARPGDRILDVGCGPGSIVDLLPATVDYIGFDVSADYVDAARRAQPRRGVFLRGTARDFLERPDPRMRDRDLVIVNALLHHLDDPEVGAVLELARAVLVDGGRLVIAEPARLAHEHPIARWLMDRDRGQHIRSDDAWARLVRRSFPDARVRVVSDLLRVPYTHVLIDATAGLSGDGTARPGDRASR